MKIAEVKNPFSEEFNHSFNGTPISIPSGKTLEAPLPIARLMAEHIARKAIRDEHKQVLSLKKKELGENSENYLKIERSAIPMFEDKVEKFIESILKIKSSIKEEAIMNKVKVGGRKLGKAPE
jgi:hypothetical protein